MMEGRIDGEKTVFTPSSDLFVIERLRSATAKDIEYEPQSEHGGNEVTGHSEMQPQPTHVTDSHEEMFTVAARFFKLSIRKPRLQHPLRDAPENPGIMHAHLFDIFMQRGCIRVTLEYFDVRQLRRDLSFQFRSAFSGRKESIPQAFQSVQVIG
jgi:hypothetical protein